MKVKFFSDYDSSQRLVERFKANYAITDEQLEFVIGEDYEYAVVFNCALELINPKAKIITIIQEPSWSAKHFRRDFLEASDYLIVHDRILFEETYGFKLGKKVIESPCYMFFHDDVDRTFYNYSTGIKKMKKLSIIMSNLNPPRGIYGRRIELLKTILNSDLDIDIYGRELSIDDRRFKGSLDYKFMGLMPYEYSIAIENSTERNYITEKFIDCVLCDTIPIYYGAPNIAEIYDQNYFRLIDLDSPTIIQDIDKIIKESAPHSTINKSIYFLQYNLYETLKDIIFKP